MVPENLVQHWESAYRRYGDASRAAASSSVVGDREAAQEMAASSRDVAAAWHEMESVPDVPWWALAALVAAAQAFEFQARDWSVRAEYGGSLEASGVSRPQVRLATRARPDGRRARSQDGSEHGDERW